jgi:hypothetical protein
MKKIIPAVLGVMTISAFANESKVPDLVFDSNLAKYGVIYDFNTETKELVKTNLKAPDKSKLYIRPLSYKQIKSTKTGLIECFKDQRLVIKGNIQLMYKNDFSNYLDYIAPETRFRTEQTIINHKTVFTKNIEVRDEENKKYSVNFKDFKSVDHAKRIKVNCDNVHFSEGSLLESNTNLKLLVLGGDLTGNVNIKSSRADKSLANNERIALALKGEDAKKITNCEKAFNGTNGNDGKNGDNGNLTSRATAGSDGGHGSNAGSGCSGKVGERGLPGIDAASIEITVSNFNKTNSLNVISEGSIGGRGGAGSDGTAGGIGGNGGRGGSGGDGYSGTLNHGKGAGRGGNAGSGGNAGNGGDGAKGGYGGRGGDISVNIALNDREIIIDENFQNSPLYQSIRNLTDSMLLLSAGGRPSPGGIFGSGGKGGAAGVAGSGGSGGDGGILVGGGHNGGSGNAGIEGVEGENGNDGEWGNPGSPGSVGYTGHKLVKVSGNDFDAARPFDIHPTALD